MFDWLENAKRRKKRYPNIWLIQQPSLLLVFFYVFFFAVNKFLQTKTSCFSDAAVLIIDQQRNKPKNVGQIRCFHFQLNIFACAFLLLFFFFCELEIAHCNRNRFIAMPHESSLYLRFMSSVFFLNSFLLLFACEHVALFVRILGAVCCVCCVCCAWTFLQTIVTSIMERSIFVTH